MAANIYCIQCITFNTWSLVFSTMLVLIVPHNDTCHASTVVWSISLAIIDGELDKALL